MKSRALVDGLTAGEFSKPVSVEALLADNCRQVPEQPGIYLVVRKGKGRPSFLSTGSGGWFKGHDPDCPLHELEANWVDGAEILYVGMAGSRGLRPRLRELVRFGAGHPVAHRGGRMLWQLAEAQQLRVRWKTCRTGQAARVLEAQAIEAFKRTHAGRRPFADLLDPSLRGIVRPEFAYRAIVVRSYLGFRLALARIQGRELGPDERRFYERGIRALARYERTTVEAVWRTLRAQAAGGHFSH